MTTAKSSLHQQVVVLLLLPTAADTHRVDIIPFSQYKSVPSETGDTSMIHMMFHATRPTAGKGER